MGNYRLYFNFLIGQGNAVVAEQEGVIRSRGGYYIVESGTEIEITVNITNEGFEDFDWTDGNVFGNVLNGIPFNYTMPERDSTIEIFSIGEFIPFNNYSLKYFHDWKTKDVDDNEIQNRIEILEKEYEGEASKRPIKSVNLRWGNDGQELNEVFVSSSLDIEVTETTEENYDEFVTGDDTKFRVIYYRNESIVFNGFISPSFREIEEPPPSVFSSSYVAVDGLKSLENRKSAKELNLVPQNLAINILARSLNLYFPVQRNLNISCDIFETRMDSETGLFQQLLCGDQVFFEDGEELTYEDDSRIENQQLNIKEQVERILKPFFCRLFIWNDEFYIIRVSDMVKESMTINRYDPNGSFIETISLDNSDQIINRFQGTKRTGIAYSEFNSTLNLDVISEEAEENEFSSDFSDLAWGRPANYPVLMLKNWDYIRTLPYENNLSVAPGIAILQWITSDGHFARIINTTNPTGLSDPNISYISFKSTNSRARPLLIVKEIANSFEFSFDWRVKRRSSSDSLIPQGQYLAFMIRIGDSWLVDNGDNTFGWQNSENIITYLITSNDGVLNKLDIKDIEVPEDGQMEIRLYQIVNVGQTSDRYMLDFGSVSIKIYQNESLINEKISYRYTVEDAYSSVFPESETYLGDAFTSLSSAAFKLFQEGNPVTKLWSRDGIEERPLLSILNRDLANIYGSNVIELNGFVFNELLPFKRIIYKNDSYVIKSIRRLDDDRKYLVSLICIQKGS